MNSNPAIQGKFCITLEDKGKVIEKREGYNIWTLTGREFLAELISLQLFSTVEADRQLFRNDRVAYLGIGSGSQPKIPNIPHLVTPVEYASGEFLAPLDSPATFPAVTTGTPKTAVRFTKTYTETELSFNGSVVITEAGLFTDGDPANNFAVGVSTGISNAFDIAPVAYKTFEPITKTSDYTLKVVWEVRFI